MSGHVLVREGTATASKRRVYFQLVDATDGYTPEVDEAGGQPQISVDGAAWTDTGIGTLSHIGYGRYYADLTQAVCVVGTTIQTRYKSVATREAAGDSVRVVAFNTDDSTTLGLSAVASNVIQVAGGNTAALRPILSGTAVGGSATTLQISDVGSGLVAHYKFDEDGAVIVDSLGNATLTVTGSLPAVAGVDGTARQFRQAGGVGTPAVNYAGVALPAAVRTAVLGSYTVAFWMRRAAGASGSHSQSILEIRPSSVLADVEVNNILLSASIYIDGTLAIGWEGGAGTNTGSNYTIPVSVGTWQHVAFTVVPSGGGSTTVTTYVDGVQTDTDSDTPSASGGSAAGMFLYLGRSVGNSSEASSQLHADLDDLRIYGRVLSLGDIQELAAKDPSSADDFYSGQLLVLTGGTGAGQVRSVASYDGSTTELTVAAWATAPDSTTEYVLLSGGPSLQQIADAVAEQIPLPPGPPIGGSR